MSVPAKKATTSQRRSVSICGVLTEKGILDLQAGHDNVLSLSAAGRVPDGHNCPQNRLTRGHDRILIHSPGCRSQVAHQ